jgi:predicted flap endonuclease-1-like 5' DNA nuclease
MIPMDNNSLIAIILVVLAFMFLLFAIYYISRMIKKKPTITTSKPAPQSTVVEAPKSTPVQLAPEPKTQPAEAMTPKPEQIQQAPAPKPLSDVIITPKAESVQMTSKIEPIMETQKAEPAQPTPEPVPQSTEVLTPKVELVQQVRASATPKSTERGSRIIDIEGIGPTYAEKLNSLKIRTTADLLTAGATPIMRRELAEKTGISPKLILEWVNLSDLLRIKGVGEEYSDLLEEAGVDTVVELGKRVPEHLHAKMIEVNETKKLVRRVPTQTMVERWVAEAKTLPRKIEY